MNTIEFIGLAILMFVLGFITDAVWALYIRKVAQKKKLISAIYSVIIVLLGYIGIGAFIISYWLALFDLIGVFLGTYYSDNVERYIKKLKFFYRGKW